MRRSDLADLNAFVAIADQRSFRAAASRLGLTPSALSHTMRQMEERLGVRLLHRTTRSVSLTDAGQRLLEQLRPAIDQIAGALDDLSNRQQRPNGNLRIHTIHMAAAAVITPIWRRFLSMYPEVRMELGVDEARIDIVKRGFDAGIGPRDRAAADMIAVRVMGPTKMAVVGAPEYFAKHSPPRTPNPDIGVLQTEGDVGVWHRRDLQGVPTKCPLVGDERTCRGRHLITVDDR